MVQTVRSKREVKGTKFKLFSLPSFLNKRVGAIILFLLPALVIYSVFLAIPLLMSLRLSLYSTSGVGDAVFIGLENFKKLFFDPNTSPRFWNALTNNFKFFIITMISQNLLALFIALILNKGLKFFGIFRTILFIPVTISIILVGYIWSFILNPNWGALNQLLTKVGLESFTTAWLGNESTALIVIAIVNSWQYIGLAIMLFLAGLQNIPNDLYEAASIDGANSWTKFTRITIPQLTPVIGIVIILTVVGNFNQFELIYAMQGTLAGPNYSTDILGTFFYRTAFSSLTGTKMDLGLGAAIASVSFVIVFCIVCVWIYFTEIRSSK